MTIRRAWGSAWIVGMVMVGGLAGCGGGGSTSNSTGVSDASAGDDGSGSMLFGDGSASRCVPKTCAEAGYTCGMNGDGCGGTLDCGTCDAPAFCGGGGYSKCGGGVLVGPDGGIISSTCTPFTC